MMQQVATEKTDIAAFAADTGKQNETDSALVGDFKRMFNEHQEPEPQSAASQKSSNKVVTNNDVKPTDTDRKSKTEEQATSKTVQENDVVDEAATVANKEMAKITAAADKKEGLAESKFKTSDSDDKKVQNNEELKNELANIKLSETSSAQTWVSLVERLQQIAAQAKPAESQSDSVKHVKAELAEKEALLLKLNGLSESEKLQALTELDIQNIQSIEEQILNLQDKLGRANKEPILSLDKNSESRSDGLELIKGDSPLAEINEQISTSALSVDQIQASIGPRLDVEVGLDSALETQALAGEVNLSSRSTSSANKVSDIGADTNIKLEAQRLAKSESRLSDGLTDVLALLIEDALGQSKAAETDNGSTQQKPNVEKLIQSVEQPSSLMTATSFGEEQSELALLSSAPVLSKEDKIKQVLNTLSKLPEHRLEKILNKINKELALNSENLDEQALSNKSEVDDIVSSANAAQTLSTIAPSKDLAAALKIGIKEFKAQAAQGREPGIDLTALINEGLGKSNAEQSKTLDATIADKIDTAMRTLTQLNDMAVQLRSAADTQGPQLFTAYSPGHDIQLNPVETSKIANTQTNLGQFDKTVNIAKPEGHAQLAEKVRWMVNAKQLVADIRLDPAELGSMHVKVNINGDAATVNFVVQSHHARDVLESATPRLREMLAEKGIELGQASVRQEQHSAQQDKGQHAGNSSMSTAEQLQEPEQAPVLEQNLVNGALGGIDYYV